MSPVRPKAPCPRCKHVVCTCPPQLKKPSGWQYGTRPTRERRPGYVADQGRRAAAVREWRAQYGDYCPNCYRTGVKLTADHLTPVGVGGEEGGPLSVLCVECHREQASRIAHEVRRKKQR